MNIRDKGKQTLSLKKPKKFKSNAAITKKSITNISVLDLLPNIKLKKSQFIESDLFIKDIVLKKKRRKLKNYKKY
jgi:hypothetical protein